jgi:hypothetical protein
MKTELEVNIPSILSAYTLYFIKQPWLAPMVNSLPLGEKTISLVLQKGLSYVVSYPSESNPISFSKIPPT